MPTLEEESGMSNLEFAIVPLAAFRDVRNALRTRNNNLELPPTTLTEKVMCYGIATGVEFGKLVIYSIIASSIYRNYFN